MSEDIYQAIDFDWLTKFANDLPIIKPDAPTLFDILGVSSRELTISRVLAYYLEEDETLTHRLKRLFLDSLLTCMARQESSFSPENYPSPYTVERERNSIDILVKSESNKWAIIIENKVFHTLENPLMKYRDSVSATNVAGVVVTLNPLSSTDRAKMPNDFVNITHESWLAEIEKSEPVHVDERHRLLFADFVQTMNNNTASTSNNMLMNQGIKLFQKHNNDITRLSDVQKELQNYIQRHIQAAFAKHGFVKSSSHYYPDSEELETRLRQKVRFFVGDKILTDNKLIIYFELCGESCSIGDELKASIRPMVEACNLLPGQAGSVRGPQFHLAHLVEQPVLVADDFANTLQTLIDRFFNTNEAGISLVTHCRQFQSAN